MIRIFNRKKTRLVIESDLLKLIQGNTEENNIALQWITVNWKKEAIGYIESKNVPTHEAEDVFFTALLEFNNNVKANKIIEANKIRKYFNSICHNEAVDHQKKWYSTIRLLEPFDTSTKTLPGNEEEDNLNLSSEIVALYYDLIENLGETCRKLLALRGVDFPMAEIAVKMGLQNERNAINRAYDCRKNLRTLAEKNPLIMNKIKQLL